MAQVELTEKKKLIDIKCLLKLEFSHGAI